MPRAGGGAVLRVAPGSPGSARLPPGAGEGPRGILANRPLHALQVDLTTSCPLRCRMCPRADCRAWRVEAMPLERLRRLAPAFRTAEAVVFSGWGEPLAYPHLEEAVRLAALAGARPGFVTSGAGLSRDRAAALVEAGVDFVGFSLAGATAAVHEAIRVGSVLEEVKEAVHALVAAGAGRGSARPRLHLVYLMVRDNLEDLVALPALARELGVREVVLTHLTFATGHWQRSQAVFACDSAGGEGEEAEGIVRAAGDAAAALGIRLAVPPFRPTWPAVCAENPLVNLHVSAGGLVSPCVYLGAPLPDPYEKSFCGRTVAGEGLVVGSLDADSVERVWDAEAYRAFRALFARRRRRDALVRLLRLPAARPPSVPPRLPPLPVPCRTCHKSLGF